LSGKNACVPEVSLYVAVITAAAGVVGAAAAQIPGVVRDIRLAGQERRERNAGHRVQACLDLLSAAGDLRTQVRNASQYHGEKMGDLLAEIRKSAAAVQLHAARVELLMPKALAAPADQLAEAAEKFADAAVTATDMAHGQMTREPERTEFDQATETFREQAVNEIRKGPVNG
jgi:hypothetical protein